ncbi:hypothetical protein P20439_0316 [Pseudoalteromonas sp. BSi20439]|nr:hypothetical protein P20439_0316 [Pseudoalteromonas sp. BSi20439]
MYLLLSAQLRFNEVIVTIKLFNSISHNKNSFMILKPLKNGIK